MDDKQSFLALLPCESDGSLTASYVIHPYSEMVRIEKIIAGNLHTSDNR
jgi:hypothetical protein